MDTSELIPTLEAAAPGAVMEMRPFGRSGEISLWISMKEIAKVASVLKSDPNLGFDWLENLSVMELDGTLVLTYFLRSSRDDAATLILRGTLAPSSTESIVEVASVAGAWPSADPYEHEASELFGIRFSGMEKPGRLLPPDWKGFPLRKSYVFPNEYAGVPHMRRGSPEKPGEQA